MKSKDFEKSVKQLLAIVESNLVQKGAEYATDDDKMHNFNVGSIMTGQCREKVLQGFLLKHLISLNDIINKIDKNPKDLPSQKVLQEKCGDISTYYALLYASIEDRINNNQPF